MNSIDPKQIPSPKIEFTSKALAQVGLILENDFTLDGKFLRIVITGKGCSGFDYSIGFTEEKEDDISVRINPSDPFTVLLDPFSAFYFQNGKVDFVQDFKSDTQEEGFVVTNLKQEDFSGKFWKQAPEKTPPLRTVQ